MSSSPPPTSILEADRIKFTVHRLKEKNGEPVT